MAKKKQTAGKVAPTKMSYEDAIEELESINRRIEEGEIGLEESLDEFRRGMALARRCGEILDAAEQEIEEIRAEELDGE